MKWSWKIGEFKGIPIYIHATFLIIIAWVVLANLGQGQGPYDMAAALLFVSLIFACVLLHELGHALAARRYGIGTKDITLLPIGGLARLERMPDEPRQELWVALAGPAVNVVIAAGLYAWIVLTSGIASISSLSLTGGLLVERLLFINLLLAGFNLLPAFPMDGGRVLRALLAMKLDHAQATRWAASIGQGMAIFFGFVGLFTNPFLVIIAVFIWIGAGQEAGHAAMRSAFHGVPVTMAMVSDFRTLGPKENLVTALDRVLSGSQREFPVTDGEQLVGILTRQRLIKSLSSGWQYRTVEEVMNKDFSVIDSSMTLDKALTDLHAHEDGIMPVVSGGRLVGILTPQIMSEYMRIRAALEKAA
jgi:Zn-dependent protease/CBS domain-containing protein